MIQLLQTILISIASVITGMVLEFQYHPYERFLNSFRKSVTK